MGSGRIRMFSLWVMVVILLLLGVDQGHARPFTWPGGPPDYWETPNWANTPPIRKFVDTLSGLNVPGLIPGSPNNLGQYIPIATPDTTTYSGSDYYEIALVQYREKMHSDLPATLLRGYVQLSTSVVPGAHTALVQREPGRDDDPDSDQRQLRPTGWTSPTTLGPSSLPRRTGRCVSSSSTRCRRGRRATSSSRWTEPSWGRGST